MEEFFWPGDQAEYRGDVVACLKLLSSKELQLEYEKDVQLDYEKHYPTTMNGFLAMIKWWDGLVGRWIGDKAMDLQHHEWLREVFTHSEQLALVRFHRIFELNVRAIPANVDVAELHESTAWQAIIVEATKTLPILAPTLSPDG